MRSIIFLCAVCGLLLSCQKKADEAQTEPGGHAPAESVVSSEQEPSGSGTGEAKEAAPDGQSTSRSADPEAGNPPLEPEPSEVTGQDPQPAADGEEQPLSADNEGASEEVSAADEEASSQPPQGPYGFDQGEVFVKRENGKIVSKFRVEGVGDHYILTRWYDIATDEWNTGSPTKLVKEQVKMLAEGFEIEE